MVGKRQRTTANDTCERCSWYPLWPRGKDTSMTVLGDVGVDRQIITVHPKRNQKGLSISAWKAGELAYYPSLRHICTLVFSNQRCRRSSCGSVDTLGVAKRTDLASCARHGFRPRIPATLSRPITDLPSPSSRPSQYPGIYIHRLLPPRLHLVISKPRRLAIDDVCSCT